MELNLFQQLIAVVLSAAIAARAYRKKSLDLSGAITGFAVMTIHIAVNYRSFVYYLLRKYLICDPCVRFSRMYRQNILCLNVYNICSSMFLYEMQVRGCSTCFLFHLFNVHKIWRGQKAKS